MFAIRGSGILPLKKKNQRQDAAATNVRRQTHTSAFSSGYAPPYLLSIFS
ncbi:MAG: hypothetical protein R3B84_21180 [Zavarzinella sp.]